MFKVGAVNVGCGRSAPTTAPPPLFRHKVESQTNESEQSIKKFQFYASVINNSNNMSDLDSVASNVEEDAMEEEYADDTGTVADVATNDNPTETLTEEPSGAAKETDKDPDKLYMQFGAHRDFEVPSSAILVKASKTYPVKDGIELGKILASRAAALWNKLSYTHITIVGGLNKTTNQMEEGPFVCFSPPEDVESDDHVWLRAVPPAVLVHYQSVWKKLINENCADDVEKKKRIKKKYDRVLNWTEDKLHGPRLNPERLGCGKGGFVLMSSRLRSIRVAPPVVPRGSKADKTSDTKLTSAISKGKSKAATSADDSSVATEFEEVSDARTLLLGKTENVQTFEKNGNTYAILF